MKGWTRLSDPKASKLEQRWRHDASGILLEHCGHPTAHNPWTGHDPRRPEAILVGQNGRAFVGLVEAMVSIDEWFRGKRDSIDRTWTPKAGRKAPLVCILRAGRTVEEERAAMDAADAMNRRGAGYSR